MTCRRGGNGHFALFAIALGMAVAQSACGDEASTARRFEEARRDEPSLIAFLKGMPKGGDLHVHVGGAIYAENLLDNALKRGLFFDPATSLFETKDKPGRIPAAKFLEGDAGDYLTQFLDKASMRGYRSGMSGHDHFFRAFGILDNAGEGMSAEEPNAEVIRRAKAQNVQYLELMTSVAPESAYEPLFKDIPPVDHPEQALATLKPKLDAFVKAAKASLDQRDKSLAALVGVPSRITSATGAITVRYIVAASRLAPDNEFFVDIAAGMALMKADRRVVGVNILAPEDHPFARTHFEAQMRLMDALWWHFRKPNITLHAGELTLDISPMEPMLSRIRKSIQVGHARRIGHGVSIAWEDDLPNLLKKMRDEGIAVEICLTSNDGILGVKGDRHPFNLYRKAGVPITLNTDDEGVNRSNLTMEFVRAVRTYRLSYREVKALVRNSVEYSFLSGGSLYLQRDPSRLHPAFASLRELHWAPSPIARQALANSEKMQVQVRLERAFVAFEN